MKLLSKNKLLTITDFSKRFIIFRQLYNELKNVYNENEFNSNELNEFFDLLSRELELIVWSESVDILDEYRRRCHFFLSNGLHCM